MIDKTSSLNKNMIWAMVAFFFESEQPPVTRWLLDWESGKTEVEARSRLRKRDSVQKAVDGMVFIKLTRLLPIVNTLPLTDHNEIYWFGDHLTNQTSGVTGIEQYPFDYTLFLSAAIITAPDQSERHIKTFCALVPSMSLSSSDDTQQLFDSIYQDILTETKHRSKMQDDSHWRCDSIATWVHVPIQEEDVIKLRESWGSDLFIVDHERFSSSSHQTGNGNTNG